MNSLSFRIALRYIRGTAQEKSISRMVAVSFLSILIGSFALALVASIMRGFEYATHEKMQSIHAQITIRAYDNQPVDYEAIAPIVEKEFPEIAAFGPTSIRQTIIQAQGSDDITHVVALKGVDPQKESAITALSKKILKTQSGDLTMEAALQNEGILIGASLAKSLGISVGDEITILFTRDEQSRSRRITLGSINGTIGGIFSTGIDEFDTGLTLCTQQFFDTIFPDAQISLVTARLNPGVDEQATIEKLKNRFDLDVYSWKELYPALVAALKLEKIAMFLILSLIILVATMNIISLLFMQIHQKRGDIAILKSMGLADNDIKKIFMYMGMCISFAACTLGLLLATIASYILENYPFITLPDAYYVSHVPARMELGTLGLVFLVIMSIAFIVTWITARSAHTINVSNILRFEA